MKLKRLLVTTSAFVALSLITGAVWYRRLPDPVPIHFSLGARPDGFVARPVGAFVTPAFLALLGTVLGVLPRIAPKRYRLDPFLRVYELMAITVVAVEFVDGMLGLQVALGHHLNVDRAGGVGLGVLMLVLGNFLGKVTRNFFVGIRTPWTLANPEVWLRTHRVGGVAFVAGGAAILIASLVGSATPVVPVSVTLGIALFVTGYSYVLWHRLERGRPGTGRQPAD